jgi:hypothetical protein
MALIQEPPKQPYSAARLGRHLNSARRLAVRGLNQTIAAR